MTSSKQAFQEIYTAEEQLRIDRRAARMTRRKQRKRARLILWGTRASCVLLLGIMGFTLSRIQSDPINTEVPLSSHDIVTLEYGTPSPKPDNATTYQFPANLKQ